VYPPRRVAAEWSLAIARELPMDAATKGWTVFDATRPLLTCGYSFGPGFATAIAVGGAEGLIVVSPPSTASADSFAVLERSGKVRALVAPNAYHTMGIAAWKERYPDAEIFAPAQSIARVEKVSGMRGIRPIAEIGEIAGPRVRFLDMPHYRTGEVLVCADTDRGLAWYVTDVIMNMKTLPGHPVARFLFRVTASAPGLRFNNIAPLFMMKDKRAVRRWLAAQASEQKPRWLIPAHGDIVDLESDRAAAERLFAAA
jgi:hypothetical protein